MDVNLRLALVELANELRQESLLELQLGQARLEAVRQINYGLLAKFTDIRHYIHEVDGNYFRNRIGPGEINDFFGLFKPENLKKALLPIVWVIYSLITGGFIGETA